MFDVVVVGGRVAGAATAILLAGQGHRVALVDSDPAPRPTLSTHVFGDWAAFGRLGVLDDARLLAAPAMRRFRTEIDGCATEAAMLATPYARALRREVLDPLLVERACSFDLVTWLPGARVTGLRHENGVVAGVDALIDGTVTPLPARVVVGADGRRSLVARAVGAEAYLTRPRVRCAYYAYFEGVATAGLPALEYYWQGDDVVIVAPCDGGLHCVCVMPPAADFAGWRARHRDRYAEVLASIETLAARMTSAVATGPVRGTGNLASYLRTPAGPGWALVGDAGAAVHPCIGAGIDHAVFSAGLFADTAHRFLSDEQTWAEAMADYATGRDARIRPTLETAVKLAARGRVPSEDVQWLQVLLGMPGSAHDLGRHAVEVLRTIAGEATVARLAAMFGDAVVTAAQEARS